MAFTNGPAVQLRYDGPRSVHPGRAVLSCLKKQTRQCLRLLELPSAEVSVLLTDDVSIRQLNRIYRAKDKATDVLSFSQWEGAASPTETMLGDIVISVETAARRTRFQLEDELLHLLIHGLLHLLGYDHASPKEKKEMFALAARLKRKIRNS